MYKHGHSKPQTSTYKSWLSMKQRCLNPNHIHYGRYGGRGISVCDRWCTFINFLDDMGERPEGMTLDRLDNDSNYNKGNCRWSTSTEQQRNKSKSRNNTSGFVGVVWHKKDRKWQATIQCKGRTIYLGQFADIKDASEAYQQAKRSRDENPL